MTHRAALKGQKCLVFTNTQLIILHLTCWNHRYRMWLLFGKLNAIFRLVLQVNTAENILKLPCCPHSRDASSVTNVALSRLSPCCCKQSNSAQAWGKVTPALPLALASSSLKLRQAVIINEGTWANGQEMQRYWSGWVSHSESRRLAPACWPVVSLVAACGGWHVVVGQPKVWKRSTTGCLTHLHSTWRTAQVTSQGQIARSIFSYIDWPAGGSVWIIIHYIYWVVGVLRRGSWFQLRSSYLHGI